MDAATRQALDRLTRRLAAVESGGLHLPAEGHRIGTLRLLEKAVGSEQHLHQRDNGGVESDLTGAKSIWGRPISDTAPTAGQIYTYNATTGQWEPSDPGAPGAHAFAGASHTADTLANVNSKISDADVPALAGEITGTPAAPTIAATHSGSAHSLYQLLSQKDAASGYCGLDGSVLIALARIPATLTGKDADTLDTYHASSFEKTANREAASGYAGLDASSKVIKDPANATATPTASKIPIADASAKLDGWVSDAAAATKGILKLTNQLGGTAALPAVTGLTETGGPTALAMGAVADGKYLKRSGNAIVGDTPAGGGDVFHEVVLPITDTLALNAEGPHVPILFASKASSVDVVYVRSKTDMTATITVYCYNQAGVQQWTQAVALSAVKYNSATGLTYSIAANDYLTAKITAYTSGGDEPLAVVRFKETAA